MPEKLPEVGKRESRPWRSEVLGTPKVEGYLDDPHQSGRGLSPEVPFKALSASPIDWRAAWVGLGWGPLEQIPRPVAPPQKFFF